MEILRLLNETDFITSYEILERQEFTSGFYIKIKVLLNNGYVLFIREYSDTNERNYSYHLQNEKDELILRWDNAPHYKDLSTFPHHKHIQDKVSENDKITLEEFLVELKNFIK